MLQNWLFDSWSDLARVLLVGTLAYAALILFLRISGKRTLAKMNAFDLVVTVALGSTLSSVLLTKDVSLAEGALAFGLLIALQFVVTWSSVRWVWADRLFKSEPSLLAHRGELLRHTMKRQRVSDDEVKAAIRDAGLPGLEQVEAVVLETDGTFSVISRDSVPPGSGVNISRDA